MVTVQPLDCMFAETFCISMGEYKVFFVEPILPGLTEV